MYPDNYIRFEKLYIFNFLVTSAAHAGLVESAVLSEPDKPHLQTKVWAGLDRRALSHLAQVLSMTVYDPKNVRTFYGIVPVIDNGHISGTSYS